MLILFFLHKFFTISLELFNLKLNDLLLTLFVGVVSIREHPIYI